MRQYSEYAVLLSMVVQITEGNMPCNQTYKANGHLCYPCNAGFHKISDCVNDNQIARCERCASGYYQPNCNIALTCEKCSQYCPDKYMVQIKECTVEADRVCQCANEMYWYKDGADDGFCSKHSLCEPGTGLLAPGNAVNNTICTSCIVGETFSNASSLDKCLKCTSCTVYSKPCTTTSDASCGNGTEYSSVTSIFVVPSSPPGPTTVLLVAAISSTLIIALIFTVVFCKILIWCRSRNSWSITFTNGNHNVDNLKDIELDAENGLLGKPTRPAAVGQESVQQYCTWDLKHCDSKDEISTSESSECECNSASNGDIGDPTTEIDTLPIGKVDEYVSRAHYSTPINAALTTTETFTSTSSGTEYTTHLTIGGSDVCRTNLTEQDCRDIFCIIARNLKKDDFKSFFRYLAGTTYRLTVETEMEHTFEEITTTNEGIYELMVKWRMRNPEAQLKRITEALKRCNMDMIANEIMYYFQTKNKR